MNILPKPIARLVESFQRLPGIGPKSAQRLALYLLHVPQSELEKFSDSLLTLKKYTVLCSVCKNVSEVDPCQICASPSRDHSTICVVEQFTDVLSIERTGKYQGVYHVLHGSIDPLNNIGPDEIYLSQLFTRIAQATTPVSEIILATNPNMEGEATAMYIVRQLGVMSSEFSVKPKLSRLAHGLPVGADIEYADEVTLSRALNGRTEFN